MRLVVGIDELTQQIPIGPARSIQLCRCAEQPRIAASFGMTVSGGFLRSDKIIMAGQRKTASSFESGPPSRNYSVPTRSLDARRFRLYGLRCFFSGKLDNLRSVLSRRVIN